MSRSEKRQTPESVAFRLDEDTATVIAAKAARHGLSIGQYARSLVINDAGRVLPVLRRGPPRDAVELRRLTAAIGKVGSNLNQLAKSANTPELTVDKDGLGRALTDLADIRNALLVALRIHNP